MNWNDFRTSNWDTMETMEKAAWLHKFLLGDNVEVEGDRFLLRGGIPVEYDANLITMCEHSLEGAESNIYLDSCLGEASALAYANLSSEQIQHPDTAKKFYRNLMMLPMDERGRCLYWAKRGERA